VVGYTAKEKKWALHASIKIPTLENTNFGKYQIWETPTLENTNFGKHQLWEIPTLGNTKFGKYQIGLKTHT